MPIPQVLAATFTIAFEGLMLFQSDAGGRKHVVLVDATDHDHKATIEICSLYQGEYNSKYCQPIPLENNDTVSFDGAPGKLDPDYYYEEHVPKLKDFIVRGHLHDDVVDQTLPHEGVLAFVSLPAGDLSTWGSFDYGVELTTADGTPEVHCFARFVILSHIRPAPSTLYVHHFQPPKTQPYPIKDGDLIFVSNISQTPPPHFHLQSRLLNAGGALGTAKFTAIACVRTDGRDRFGSAIEKVLFDRDSRVPNGDCGPTGP
jgi:hypothetical protein